MDLKNIKENKKLLIIIAILLLIIGLCIILYPIFSNYLAKIHSSRVIQKYNEKVNSEFKDVDIEAELEKAKKYNQNLAGYSINDPFSLENRYDVPEDYYEILNINGIIGYIEIPKISVKLPIYHGTKDEDLEKGVGHIESTSLPVGGASTHSVLTGHSGLPSAKLFTNLDKLKKDDNFYIHVLNMTLAYKVYKTEVIEPSEIEKLQIVKGSDIVTLLTCTPYGVNTHRLLVYGARTEYKEDIEQEEIKVNKENELLKYMLIGLIIGIIILVMIIIFIKRKSEKKDIEK